MGKTSNKKNHSARTTMKKKMLLTKNHWRAKTKKMCIDRQFITNTLFFSWHYAKRLLFPSCVLALFSINDTLYGGCLDVVWNAQHTAQCAWAREIKSGRKTCDIRSYFAYNLVTFLFVLGNLDLFFLFFWLSDAHFVGCIFFSSPFACISSDCESNKCAFRHYDCCFSFT